MRCQELHWPGECARDRALVGPRRAISPDPAGSPARLPPVQPRAGKRSTDMNDRPFEGRPQSARPVFADQSSQTMVMPPVRNPRREGPDALALPTAFAAPGRRDDRSLVAPGETTWSEVSQPAPSFAPSGLAELRAQSISAWFGNCLLYTSPSPRDG